MRKLFVLAALAAVALVAAVLGLLHMGASTASHPSGLVAYWPFDEGSGITATDVALGNDGTITGATYVGAGAPAVPGNVDALRFDGVNDFVQVPNDSSLEPSSVTVQAWVNRSGTPGQYRYILSKGASGCTAASYALYTGGSGGLHFYVFNGSSFVLSPDAGTGVWNGEWHHVAGSFDGSNVRLYVDGLEVGSGTSTAIGIGYGLSPGNDLLVGAYRDSCYLHYGGLIDEVCVWNRALGTTEITAHANGAPCQPRPVVCPPPSGLVSWWPGDGNANDIADANDGTLLNGATATASGKVGQAFSFDGTNDYVGVPDTGPVDLDGFSELTIDAWINFDTSGSGMCAPLPSGGGNVLCGGIVSKYNTQSDFVSYYLAVVADELRLFVAKDSSNYHWETTTSADLAAGTWYHVAGTWDGSQFKLYVNGVAQASTTTIGKGLFPDAMQDSSVAVNIGDFESSAGGARFGFFDGIIDEVEIFDSALTQAEIQDIFAAGSNGKCKAIEEIGPVELRTVDQQKPRSACLSGAGHCRELVEGAVVRVFDRDDLINVGKNPSKAEYPAIFASGLELAECTTGSTGLCTLFEPRAGNYLVIVRIEDDGTPIYVGKPKSADEFGRNADGVLEGPTKEFQVIKVIKKNGDPQYSGGVKVVVNGSYLEVVHPDFAIWEDVAAGFVYPFIFTSDSDWDVDICAYVPTGYAIVGVYDENGDLVADSACTQTFVTGETKVVAYEVVDIGSPEPVLDVLLTVEHEGTVTEIDVEVPGVRTNVEPAAEEPAQPAQLPTTGGEPGDGGTPVWAAVAALAGVTIMLFSGIAVWRRRRA